VPALPWNIAEKVKSQLSDLAERATQFVAAVPTLKVGKARATASTTRDISRT